MLQARLLEVAIDQFGKTGFEGASTREIACAAGTGMSSITYHFGGKQGLYLACADHIACQIGAHMRPGMPSPDDIAELGPDAAAEHFLTAIDSLAEMMLHPDSACWSRFIVREQQEPTEAFDRLWCGVMQDMVESSSLLLGRIFSDMESRERRAMTMLIFGQVMVLRAARASVCKALGTPNIGEDDGHLLRQFLRRNTIAILKAEN